MIVLTAVYLVWPSGSSLLVSLVGAGTAGAIGVGVRRYRPRRAASWMLLAASLVFAAAARVLYDALPGVPGTLKPGIWMVWVLHVSMLILLGLGVLSLARNGLRGISAIIDMSIILLGTGLVLGVLIAIPYAATPGIGALWESVRVAYVVRDVLVLALAGYLAISMRRNSSMVLLEIGLLALFVHDVLFRTGRIRGEWLAGTPFDIGWLLFFVAIGAAALVPSMTRFDDLAPTGGAYFVRGEQSVRVRLGLVMIAALMPSAILIVGWFEPPHWYQGLLVLAATAVLLLAFARVLDVTAQLRGQARGERVVRGAVSELADAQDASGIATALDGAIGQLIKPGRDYRIALAPAPPPGSPVLAEAANRVRLLDTKSLPRAVAAQLGAQGVALAVPLDLAVSSKPRRDTGDRGGGVRSSLRTEAGDAESLFVRADQDSLWQLRPRLEALAAQAGLALQRIRLNEQVMQNTREAYFRTLVQKTTDVILIVDDDDRIRYATPSAASLVGPLPLAGVSLLDLVEPADRGAAGQLLAKARAGIEDPSVPIDQASPATERVDWTVSRKRGSPAQVEISCRDLRADPSIDGLVLTLRNVTEQRRLENELAERAFRDPLTGLGNRRLFTERLEVVVRRQTGVAGLAGVLFIDLDDMKLINDGLGHETGDAILITIAQRLTDFVIARHGSAADMASRLGGDEFAVLLADAPDQGALDLAADALSKELARPVHAAGTEVPCTASIGVATTADADSVRDLLRNADLALYAAKGIGKGQWRRYEPWMRSSLTAKLALRASLGHALENNEFFLEYQPIVRLPDGKTVGFEALLRWQHPTRGRLSPDAFIDVAEESGFISSIGEWVLATAFSAAGRWRENSNGAAPYVAVNVSARQFGAHTFAGTLRRLLAESGLPPDRVMVEITESLLLREDDRVWLDLQELRSHGVRIAIDDFGTGYSALSYLRQVPLDVVKLDRSFITSMVASTKQRELVRGIVGLASLLDLEVVAEGIETEAENAAAKQVGCDFGQGFLFSRPLPDHEAARWIARDEPSARA